MESGASERTGGNLDRRRVSLGTRGRGRPGEAAVRAPGRVNLIGEHTDYHDGLVLPFAIGAGVTATVRLTGDGRARIRSDRFEEPAEFALTTPPAEVRPGWARYPAAALRLLREAGVECDGLDARLEADLAPGSGLSSSAALLTAFSLAILEAVGGPAAELLPSLCREAEDVAAGVRCGIMDPFVSLHARKGRALLLDCRDLTSRFVPIDPEEIALVIADSGVRRALAAGEYARRREEGEEAIRILDRRGFPIRALRDIAPDDLPRALRAVPDLLGRRVRHVVTENARTAEAAAALDAGDLDRLGALLDASHESLRADYEVSCPELDALAARARAVPGVLGSRMTGGGFGGFTVTAARPDAVDGLLRALPGAVVVTPSDGARTL